MQVKAEAIHMLLQLLNEPSPGKIAGNEQMSS